VQPGDTFSATAKSHEVFLSVQEAANPGIENFDVILPGEHVNVPSGDLSDQHGGAKTFTVEPGDCRRSASASGSIGVSSRRSMIEPTPI
jgi:LysM repeat protein